MIQKEFAKNAVEVLKNDDSVIGITAGGSWLTDELDEYSDLDLILVTKDKVAGNKEKMISYAGKMGNLLNAFTGEHVGDPRVLICLYDNPLLHVDIKFLTPEEFHKRVEDPFILHDTEDQLKNIIEKTEAKFPTPGFQWMEDRFWTWVHYDLVKIGRGEYFEAHDGFAFFRDMILGPLIHIKNGNLPRGVRKVETHIAKEELELLKRTIPQYDRQSLIKTLEEVVSLYRKLREDVFTDDIILRTETESKVMEYFEKIKKEGV
ncbi:MAG: aminoglycoside 6-adenylyltransferase [Ignavibacteriae bacterium]|nr:aminoglycoside 6-adenylyltransferase [Ignavibacteriota bacterium]